MSGRILGLVLTGHNAFAGGALAAAEMIMGEQEGVSVVDFPPEDDVDSLHRRICDAVDSFPADSTVVILADLAGGSPFNRAMMCLAERPQRDIHVLSGLNLPLLIEAISLRGTARGAREYVGALLEAGRRGVCYGNDLLRAEMERRNSGDHGAGAR